MGSIGHRVLVVDDEPAVAAAHVSLLHQLGYDAQYTEDSRQVYKLVRELGIEIVMLDLRMPLLDGTEVLKELRLRAPQVGVVIATVVNDIEQAVRAIKSGAYNYLLKPITGERLGAILRSYFENRQGTLVGSTHFTNFVTQAPQFEEIFRKVVAYAKADIPVLVCGETGTGKELVAQFLHATSPRRDAPFIAVNVAAIPEEIFESEMFGHRRGSFTGAIRDKIGYFEAAGEGTLFLDEIGELTQEQQKKLLRVLQEKQFCKIGDTTPVRMAGRVVFATNRDLKALSRQGQMREDLYFRLSSHIVTLPPLRERGGDIRILARYFFKKYCSQYGRLLDQIEEETFAILEAYAYPGNVRELEGIISSAVLLEQSSNLRACSLPSHLLEPQTSTDDLTSLESVRFQTIFSALNEYDGNQTKAAKKLGIARETLNRFLRQYRNRAAGSSNRFTP